MEKKIYEDKQQTIEKRLNYSQLILSMNLIIVNSPKQSQKISKMIQVIMPVGNVMMRRNQSRSCYYTCVISFQIYQMEKFQQNINIPSSRNIQLFLIKSNIIFNFMSKINSDFLKKTITEMLTTRKQRKFVETVELQIGLRDYDPDKRFNGTVRLPHKAYNNIKVCVLANAAHIEEANANGIPYIDVDGLKAFNKDKTKIKKWAKKYDVLLASDSVAKQTTKLLGNVLVKMGLFPVTLAEGEKITAKIDQLKHTVKFQSKKASCLGTAIGTIETGEDNIRQNLTMSINFLVSLMKKGWQNVGTLHLKTSMGRSYRIFG